MLLGLFLANSSTNSDQQHYLCSTTEILPKPMSIREQTRCRHLQLSIGVDVMRGVGEGEQTPPGVTLLVHSKTRGKAALHMMLEGQKDRGDVYGEIHAHALEIPLPQLNQ